jgi:hypothetical protein
MSYRATSPSIQTMTRYWVVLFIGGACCAHGRSPRRPGPADLCLDRGHQLIDVPMGMF